MYKTKTESFEAEKWVYVKPTEGSRPFPWGSELYYGDLLLTMPLSYLPPDGWYAFAKHRVEIRHSVSGQQLNPTDDPPGIGYKALKLSGAYIPMMPLHRTRILIDGEFQAIPLLTMGHGPYGGESHLIDRVTYYNWEASTNLFSFPHNDVFAYSSFLSDLDQKAIRNLYASLGKRKKINGGVLLVELRETMNSLGKACTSLIQLIHAVKRGDLRSAQKVLREYGSGRISNRVLSREHEARRARRLGKNPPTKGEYASNLWLELQFAWLPLVNDIFDIISYIEETKSKSGATPWMSFSGYSEGSFYSENVKAYTNGFNITWTVTDYVRVAYTATFTMESPLKDALNSIGLLNPASVAWESVPFSFIIDWFVPVNNWIDSFTAYAGLEFKEVCSSRKIVRSAFSTPVVSGYNEYTGDWPPNGPFIPLTHEGKPHRIHGEKFDRTILTDVTGFPDFPSNIVESLDNILQPWKLITASSLFKALTGRR